ncbi:EBP2 (YKL172W) [Zygosaccharomyces parabailii]|nr:EBP2 (YKL172W) [Zygosaccharomyces parabailii]CDH16467.1 related to rRNA-processing protein EBP2 [Zygosaccharomyces bailii ISA1307]
MAKGAKLKEMLSRQREQEKLDKKEKSKKERIRADLKNSEPTVVTAEDVEAAKESQQNNEPEEYQSKALSKKERRKLKKQIQKEQQQEPKEDEEEEELVEEDEEQAPEQELDFERLAQSESDEEEDDEEEGEQGEKEDDQELHEGEHDILLSDVEFDSDADVVPYQKLTINNTKALNHSLGRVQLSWNKSPFEEHLSVTSNATADAGIKDIYDDTERELAFYKQSLDAVVHAREQLKKRKIPFKRPLDYFAEMVKSDEHMDKIKGKLVQEASEKKARQDARRQRDLKKFGKQVQVATLQKRQLEKRDTLEKIKALKNKRKHSEIGEDEFNVGVEEAAAAKKPKVNHKREAKNSKYGQGGMKRFKRKNDANSAADVSGFSHRKMKGRPGKSRRQKKY